MKRILATGFILALVTVGFASSAQAAPADPGCFGEVHQLINKEGYFGFANVGEVVQAFEGGQGKNAIAQLLCGTE